MRAAATGVPGRALPGSTCGGSGWWRAGTPPSPLPAPGVGIRGCSPVPLLAAPVSLGASTVQQQQLVCRLWHFTRTFKRQLCLGTRQCSKHWWWCSPLQGTTQLWGLSVSLLLITAAHHISVYLWQLQVQLFHFFWGKNAINTHYNLHKIFQQPRLKSVFMCLEFILNNCYLCFFFLAFYQSNQLNLTVLEQICKTPGLLLQIMQMKHELIGRFLDL